MLNRKRIYIILSAVVVFSISVGIGYLIMESSSNRDISNKNISDNDIEKNTPDIEITGAENIITPNTFIEERTYYKECGHLDSEVYLADDDIVNMTRDEYETYLYDNSNYRLISFTNTKITIWGERNHLCTNHYIIGEEDGKIAIFTIDENGERVLERIFEDYHINVLQQLDREKIIKGIIVDSQDELSEILENFIS